MERTRGDEQNVISLYGSITSADCATFDQRQQVALYAFTGHVGTRGFRAPRDLVEFIDKHDSVLFDVIDRAQLQVLVVYHF